MIAGTGANSTEEAVELSRFAKKAGAVAGLSVVPYYKSIRPRKVFIGTSGGSPKRSTCHCICTTCRGGRFADLSNDTAVRLAEVPNIVGIKADATGNIERACDPIARHPQTSVYG